MNEFMNEKRFEVTGSQSQTGKSFLNNGHPLLGVCEP